MESEAEIELASLSALEEGEREEEKRQVLELESDTEGDELSDGGTPSPTTVLVAQEIKREAAVVKRACRRCCSCGAAEFTLEYNDFQPVENKVAEARDHLANERTFLSYLRSGFAFAGLAVLFAAFSDSNDKGVISAWLLVILGIFYVIYGTFRYFYVCAWLERQMYPINKAGAIMTLLVSAILSTAAFVVAILGRREKDSL